MTFEELKVRCPSRKEGNNKIVRGSDKCEANVCGQCMQEECPLWHLYIKMQSFYRTPLPGYQRNRCNGFVIN